MKIEISVNPPLSGYHNMNWDFRNYQQVCEETKKRQSSSCLIRIYEWDIPTISTGTAQKKIKEKIFTDHLLKDQIPQVERLTGGRIVLHHREITYSIVAPIVAPNGKSNKNPWEHLFGHSLFDSYETIAKMLIRFLKKIGINAHYRQSNQRLTGNSLVCYDLSGFGEILVDGHKLIGSAQKRSKNAFLQHGSIPFYRHGFQLENYLKSKYLPAKKSNYIFINDFTSISISTAKDILRKTFLEELTR